MGLRITSLCLLLLLLWNVKVGYTQSTASGPELSWEGKITGEKEIVMCSLEGKKFTIDVSLEGNGLDFKDGAFELDFGNGTRETALFRTDFPRRLEYDASGEYVVTISAETTTGQKVATTYTVRTVKRPVIKLEPASTDIQCLGSEVFYLVDIYNQNTKGTKYTLSYDDGSAPDVMTNDELKTANGKFKHIYTRSYCHPDHPGSSKTYFEVSLLVENECGDSYSSSMSFQEKVAEPIKASFTFSELNAGYACTFMPVKLHNTTLGGTDIDCSQNTIKWEWELGNGKKLYTEEPDITYQEAREAGYKIRLVASNDYECARDTAYEHIVVVERVKAAFDIDKNKLCSGDVLACTNKSTGGGRLSYRWTIIPPAGVSESTAQIINGENKVSHPQIRFDHFGVYKVELYVDNGCSSDVAVREITVLQDPEISLFFEGFKHELDSICPQVVGADCEMDMKDYISYEWNGNLPKLHWTITPEDGVAYQPGYGADTEFPRFSLQPGRTYEIRVELEAATVNGIECGDPQKRRAVQKLKVNNPEIQVQITPDPLPGSDGVIRICFGETVTFTNTSTGENLRHRWSITDVPGTKCQSGWAEKNKINNIKEASPTITFKAYGDYYVTDTLISWPCYRELKTFQVHVGKAPTITYFDMRKDSLVCTGSVVVPDSMQVKIAYAWYNNEPGVEWECPAGVGIADKNALYPELTFPSAGTYTIKVKLNERNCPAPDTKAELERTIRVRQSDLNCELLLDETDFCENRLVLVTNSATDIEGGEELKYRWNVEKNGVEYENTVEVSEPFWNRQNLEYGDYKVKGTVIGYCDQKADEIAFTVHKDPGISFRGVQICPGELAMDSLVGYQWYNNADQTVVWEVVTAPDGGLSGLVNELTPLLALDKPGDYVLKMTVNQSGWCSDQPISKTEAIHVYDTMIRGEVKMVGFETLADICEGYTLTFTNTTFAERELHWHWEVENVTEGYEFEGGGTTSEEKEAALTFFKYGDYVVRLTVEEGCNTKFFTFPVTVRGVPEIVLPGYMPKICQGGEIDMKDYLVYEDAGDANKNNTLTYQWTVEAQPAVATGPEIISPTADFTKIKFPENAHYTVILKVGMKCAGDRELQSEIDVLSTFLKSSFTVGDDSVGCVNDPNPYQILLQENATGDSLAYTWTIQEDGWEWINGDSGSESPEIRINKEGNYSIRLHVENGCKDENGRVISDDSVFRVKAFAIPTIEIQEVSHECEVFSFKGSERIAIDSHNDPLLGADWTFISNTGDDTEKYIFTHGTTAHSFYPDLDFQACDYTVTAKYRNRCVTPGEITFQVKVDEFIGIQPLADDTICELAAARLLHAQPEGGLWTLKDQAIPEMDQILYTDQGNSYFYPGFNPYEQHDIELVYSYQNGACIARDTLNMRIWPLPHVEAGDPLGMCFNNPPVALVGRDSAAGAVWQENRGEWKLGQQILTGHLFPVHEVGDYKLKYYFTDDHQCSNQDSMTMTVHPLPVTNFTVEPQNCIYTDVMFTPEQSEGNTFEWSFGDDTPHGHSEGEILHSYEVYGFRDIICRAETIYGCKDTSGVVQIEIINLPPPAFFDVDTLQGCAPFEVNIQVDTNTYTDDHNYLSFHWNYGDGIETDTLMPIVPKFYPSGSWDTTYVARLTVSNVCDTVSYDTTITVFSAPKVSFALMHAWECSPVWLELQNTTTGNNCVFNWTFTNARTGEVVAETDIRNPEHEFTTDAASTDYYITLKAENHCNIDEYTDTLVVKPRQISAHFTPLENPYACVNQEIVFRNNSTDTVSSILSTHWDLGDGTQDTVWSPQHKYDEQGTYLVSLRINNGCGWDTISSPVTIYPLPKLEIKSEDYLCEADTFTFVVHSDQVLEHVEWKFGDGETGNKDSLRYVYEGYGTFPVTVVGVSAEINQCTDSVMKEIVVYNKPILTIEPVDTIQCTPYLYQPEITGEAYLMWDYGDQTGETSAREHWYVNNTDTVQRFRVKIYAETDKGCKSEYQRGVVVPNKPRAILDKRVEKGNPQKVIFINLSEECTDCIWNLPYKGSFHSFDDQMVEFGEQGLYQAELIVENVYGCQDTAVLEHKVLIKGLYFPNTFIPHSLNKKINHFNGVGTGLSQYKLEIFDQYGNKIWETQALENGQPSEGWDGCNQKGERMPQGMYIWRAKAIFEDAQVWTGDNNDSGVPETTQGTVLLLRE